MDDKTRTPLLRRRGAEIAAIDFRLDRPLKESPQRLIGYGYFEDIFMGLIPLADYDDNGAFRYLDDFPEIFPNDFPTTQRTGSAVLFTGPCGCGKHTADYAFMSAAYRFVSAELEAKQSGAAFIEPEDVDGAMELYQVSVSAYEEFSESLSAGKLDELFRVIEETALAHPAKLCYFSFGDVTRVLNSRRLGQRFADLVWRLTSRTGARCILTAVYEGRAADLHEPLKKPFYLLEVDSPDHSAREEYFVYLLDRYRSIRFGMNARELAELTKGLSFAKIKQLAGYLLMTAKSKLKKDRLEIQQVRFGTLENAIELDRATILRFADSLRSTQYAPPTPPTPPAPPTPPRPYQPPQPEREDPPKDDPPGDETGSDAERVVKRIDTPEQLRDAIDQLIVPSGFRTRIVMEDQTLDSDVMNNNGVKLSDILAASRAKGVTNLSNLKTITVTLGGRLVLHVWDSKKLGPALTDDSYDYSIVVSEGSVRRAVLTRLGKDEQWLAKQLRKQGCDAPDSAYIAFCDEDNELMVFRLR